jgi:hypothetical protein
MLSQDRQREILALGLLALALFLLLGLVPSSWLGERGEGWFPSGNIMGAVGAGIQAALFYFLGFSTLLLPALLALGGLRTGDWVSRPWTLRLTILAGGLLLLLPPGLHVLTRGSPEAGVFGAWTGAFLVAGLGVFGSLFLLTALTVLLLVGTLGWNPLLPVGRGAVQGAGLLGKSAQRARTGLGGWYRAWVERRKAQAEAAREQMEAPADSDTFSFFGEVEGSEADETEPDASPPEGRVGDAEGGASLGEDGSL